MRIVLYTLARCGQLTLAAAEFAMLMRALLSWFVRDGENRLMMFLVLVTEPFIIPIRLLCSRIRALDGMLLDIPFFITFLLLSLLNSLLPTLVL